jgi:hypothetical protein
MLATEVPSWKSGWSEKCGVERILKRGMNFESGDHSLPANA